MKLEKILIKIFPSVRKRVAEREEESQRSLLRRNCVTAYLITTRIVLYASLRIDKGWLICGEGMGLNAYR